jgi:hypothetical protein
MIAYLLLLKEDTITLNGSYLNIDLRIRWFCVRV